MAFFLWVSSNKKPEKTLKFRANQQKKLEMRTLLLLMIVATEGVLKFDLN